MKIRTGFVSNSSSSSFICKVCQLYFEAERGSYSLICEDCIDSIEYPLTLSLERKDVIENNIDSDWGELMVKAIKEKEEKR